jgi:hypothetical protein
MTALKIFPCFMRATLYTVRKDKTNKFKYCCCYNFNSTACCNVAVQFTDQRLSKTHLIITPQEVIWGILKQRPYKKGQPVTTQQPWNFTHSSPNKLPKQGVSQTCKSISASRPTCQNKNNLRTSTALQAVLVWGFIYTNCVSSFSFYFIHLRNMSTKIYNFKSWNVLCELHVSQFYTGHDVAIACTHSLLYVSCFK